MTSVIKHHARAFMLSVATAALLAPALQADCSYELFNISSVKGTSVGEFVDQISDECGMSVVVTDEQAEEVLKKPMNKTFLKNLTINEVLDLIIKENNLQYTLQNNVLKVSYLSTKTYNIDYITTERKGTGSTNIRLSSNSGTTAGASGTTNNSASNNASSESGTNISTVDEVRFWETLEKEIKSILSRPEDDYRQKEKLAVTPSTDSKETKTDEVEKDTFHNIYINKSAGLVTVTGTGKQIQRLDSYMDDLQKKMQTQVLIDVKMYSVVFTDGSTTGIDWSQIYNLQNFNIGYNKINLQNVSKFTDNKTITEGTYGDKVQAFGITGGSTDAATGNFLPTYGMYDIAGARAPVSGTSKMFNISNSISINNLIMFLKTQGDVYAISNPKILTLNNQPALITAGTELFYKTISTSTLATGTTGTTGTTELISSVFSGVLLDITPEISKEGTITLRINPSVSETASTISTDNSTRTMPPDLSRRQISTVVTVQDGNRVLLGGLINRKSSNTSTKVPLLGDIPLLGYMFKQDGVNEKVEELVIIIEPHIVKKEKDTLSLSDLGYTRVDKAMATAPKEEETKKEDTK
ncbi:secretin N-terminal domain-containing protein [Sulfuricurvum sp.]|uniref:secretin N-terminal domain-containing protein n=1 Tax=Sulfuricurvum sp. TaxID=2025608 RepID=UPI002E37104A|nr:secretin N-terminal domain-containing protein [Sulfuricurvum sp.]HEX5330566.1 secretin N-terminal domain-containing protein [Sulfuricurvum sp.]